MKPFLQSIVVALLFFVSCVDAAIAPGGLIVGRDTTISIERVTADDKVISYDLPTGLVGVTTVVNIKVVNAPTVTVLYCDDERIAVTHNQLFWDADNKQWLRADQLTTNTKLVTRAGRMISCVEISVEKNNAPLYEIHLKEPHTFFLGKCEILAHNFLPLVAIGLTYVIGEGLSLSFGIGIGLHHCFHEQDKKNQIKLGEMKDITKGNGGSSKGPDDYEEKEKSKITSVENMKKFFTVTEFGKEIKDKIKKTKKIQQKQSVYEVKEKIDQYRLDKGDQLYLDNMHKDHFEVFSKEGRFKQVINLDGSFNAGKTISASGRRI